MPDVFVSYKQSDKDRVRPLVEHLRAAGLEVWWDEAIQPSTSWRAEIAKHLSAAKCVVAVWTHDSVDHDGGRWVIEEATHGLSRNVLAPVRLDLVSPPLGFGEVQYADLAAWGGSGDDPRLQHLISVVKSIVAAEPIAAGPRPTSFEAPGIKMQNVAMENVRIVVGDAYDEDEDADAAPPAPSRRARRSFSMSMTRVIGVALPVVGLLVAVSALTGAACGSQTAPAALCRAYDAVMGR